MKKFLMMNEAAIQSQLRQQFLKSIPSQKDKDYLQGMFAAGMTLESNGKGGYKFKRNGSIDLDRWKDFKSIASKKKTYITALQSLPSLEEKSKPQQDSNQPSQSLNNSQEVKTSPYSEEEIAAAKEYFNRCHNYVFHVAATKWLLKHGLYHDIDRWNIGFDVEENAIIIPVDEVHYGKYAVNKDTL